MTKAKAIVLSLPITSCHKKIPAIAGFVTSSARDFVRLKNVSRTMTAPAVLAQSQAPSIIVQENNDLRETLARLNERLNEPFVTVNTVTGAMHQNLCLPNATELVLFAESQPRLSIQTQNDYTLSCRYPLISYFFRNSL